MRPKNKIFPLYNHEVVSMPFDRRTKESNIGRSYCNVVAPFTTPIVTIQASFYEIRATTSSPPVYMEIECAYRSSVHLPSTPAPDTV